MFVQDVMVSDLPKISPSATIAEAAATMLQRSTTMLLVADGYRLLGTITEADIMYSVVAQGFSPNRQIWEFMDFSPPTTKPDADVFELINLMDKHRLTKIPVIDKGRLVGTVTLAGIAARLNLV